MLPYIVIILASFIFTFAISIPFIKLLYKFNIRRVSKAELDSILPGRQVKFGTPIMGGTVILICILAFSFLLLRDWEYFPLILIVSILGGIVGGIDEYTNTLGRTFIALRKSQPGEGFSLFPVKHPVYKKIKAILLKPWSIFEEQLRMLGSKQKGLKSHYKLLMHLAVCFLAVMVFYANFHSTDFYFLSWISINLGVLYFVILLFAMLFMANAFGITDGMDGLSAGTHTITFALLGILAVYYGFHEIAVLSFIIVGAELAFLYFNISPARMEMSDVGTLPLGIFLAVIAFLMNKEFALLFLGGLYIIEILSSMIQVWSVKLRQKRVFLVAPIHHHFEKMGWSEAKVTMRFWLVNLLLGLVGLIVALL